MFLSYAMEWLAVAVGGLGLLLGILIGRSWGVRRRIELAVQAAETATSALAGQGTLPESQDSQASVGAALRVAVRASGSEPEPLSSPSP